MAPKSSVATSPHKGRSVPFRGGAYVANLMAELSRVGIAQRIQAARNEAGLKQHELADILHVHSHTIQNWESQKAPITPWDRLGEIANALGVTKQWLLHGEDQPNHLQPAPPVELLQEVGESVESLMASQESVHGRLTEVLDRLARIEAQLSSSAGAPQGSGTAGNPGMHQAPDT